MIARPQYTPDETIRSVNATLQETIHAHNAEFLGMKIRNLETLKSALEQFRSSGDVSVLNQSFEMKNVLETKTISCLSIASTYCKPAVAEFLLQNGAKADNDTVHHAIHTLWPDIDGMLDVFAAYGVNLDAAKDGHTPLYNAKRRASGSSQYDHIVGSLARHHATMFTTESLTEPLLRAADRVTEAYDAVTGFIVYPR